MANMVEAYEALKAGKSVSWHGSKARLSSGIMVWRNGNPVIFDDIIIQDWKIEEPEPEGKYVDCPVFENGGTWSFKHKGKIFKLYKAPMFDLIGYVYADDSLHATPTINTEDKSWDRCIAVRITTGV